NWDGCSRPVAVACCPAQPERLGRRAAGPANAAVRHHPRRRGCYPPAVTVDPASATEGEALRDSHW
ncbi:MAG: hypothetical protein ACRDRA_14650, partial [Pseudonocardiaceae bacterium]